MSRKKGPSLTVDRLGIPAVNTVFVPFARKDEYNAAPTTDDKNGVFVGDIVATLMKLGTDETSINILAGVAVRNGDILRLNLATTNERPGGGNIPPAAFPNGRRPADDVIDTIITLVNNRELVKDNVNANDVAFRSEFPFFAAPTQPFPAKTVDDRTRN